ncbi:MAG: hypothetical protein N2517_09505, partial [Ignavibacteria bacterium]|nr:hypothetical protein [Ignavibacteria bacterium]
MFLCNILDILSTILNVVVSILVLVDVSLQLQEFLLRKLEDVSFNPCFGGCFSATLLFRLYPRFLFRFNPCFGGCFSATALRAGKVFLQTVFQSLFWWMFLCKRGRPNTLVVRLICFKPCFGGGFSATRRLILKP